MSQTIRSIKKFEQKWLLVTKKLMRPRAQVSFDDILKQCLIQINTLHSPGRVSKTNNNIDMMSYAEILAQDTIPYDLNKKIPPKSSLKRNFIVSYDINATNDFPNISNPKNLKQKINTRTRDAMRIVTTTSTIAPPLTKKIFPHSLMITTRQNRRI